jgi:hypothetical protein
MYMIQNLLIFTIFNKTKNIFNKYKITKNSEIINIFLRTIYYIQYNNAIYQQSTRA